MIWKWIIFIVILLVGVILVGIKSRSTTKRNSSTPPPSAPKQSRDWGKTLTSVLWALVALFLVILIGVWIARGIKKLDEPRQKALTEIPDPVYENDYYLKKGEEIIIHINPEYHYGYDGYGKQYYRQSFYENGEVGPKELIGGGIPLKHNGKGSIKVIKVILSVNEKEGRVTVYHSKDLEQLMKK